MSRLPVPLWTLSLIVLALLIAGCSTPAPQQETGSVQLTSSPAGAEVYLDSEYHGTTPTTIPAVTAGTHTVEVRLAGYEPWSAAATVSTGSTTTVSATLLPVPAILPVTFATTAIPEVRHDIPQIHVDGYWTFPPGTDTTTNPVPLLVHTEAFNVGSTDARVVTVSANFYYNSRMVCWNTIYLGTLSAGGHVARDSMVSCTLPSGLNSPDLSVRFENLVVTR